MAQEPARRNAAVQSGAPGVQQQWANVGVQLAKVEGNIATLDARIAQKQGRPVGVPVATQFP